MPYLKGGFEVHGLPEGITFKKPYNYGHRQIKQIMLAANNVYFSIKSSSDEPVCQENGQENGSEEIPADGDIHSLLSKIGGVEAAERAVHGGKIEEDEVEVVDLCISASERLTLYASCLHFFTPDAWLSVGVNMKHSDEATSLVLPIYTTADEQFWLFHTISKPMRIMKTVNTTKIRGRWLDLRGDGSYCLINHDEVLGKNIIRTAHGPLYFECSANLDSEEPFHLPVAVRSVILATLRQSGLSTL